MIMSIKRCVILLMLGMFATVLPRVAASFAYNMVLVLLDWDGLDNDGIRGLWYGIGTHKLSESEITPLVERIAFLGADQKRCSDRERLALDAYAHLPLRSDVSNRFNLRDVALRARGALCEGKYDQALEILRQSEGVIQRLSVLYRSGRKEEAFALASEYICEPRTDWCYWCVRQMYSMSGEDEERLDSIARRYTNEQEGRRFSNDLMPLGPLSLRWVTGLTITRKVPFSIAGVISKRDNYIEYLTLPVTGSVVRYRLKGVVTGGDTGSCIFPRLVFSGEKGDYLGEAALRYDIKGKFEVELWWPLSPDVKNITPRITFDESCFARRQEVVICSTDLAVIP